jgi:DNA-binding CsgD family transcriptional regulator
VPIIIDDTEKDPLFSQYSFDDGYKPRSILCLTLPAQGGPTPVLYLDNNLATHGFSEELTGFVRRLALLILQILATAGAALNPSQESTAAAAKEEPAPISLTDKEAAILSLMASGLSNAEIARRLQIAEGTVKWHTNRLFKKLEVENRTQAVVRAAELGLLELE